MSNEPSIVIAALYKFAALPDFAECREVLADVCEANQVMGTILLAAEGVNGTVAGPRTGIDAVLSHIRAWPGFAALEHKESFADENPFLRMKVRLKKEIVTLGVPGVSPTKQVGQYVEPKDWNELISRDDVVLIDTRNDYEVAIGTFKGAVDPHTRSFREFPAWLKAQTGLHNKPKLAMFCTGGIRCEKSTSLALKEGFEEVYHLQGGILKYLEDVPRDESLWQGECFVFDQRVSVDHDLNPGQYDLCHACRHPITETDKQSDSYEPGVSCPHCVGERTAEQRARARERQRQVHLARQQGIAHLGAAAAKRQHGNMAKT